VKALKLILKLGSECFHIGWFEFKLIDIGVKGTVVTFRVTKRDMDIN
jgi:hypothetical protein